MRGAPPIWTILPRLQSRKSILQPLFDETWLADGVERKATEHAIRNLVPEHLREVRTRREALVDKTLEQGQARLLGEIRHWDQRANDLRARQAAGRGGDKLNSANARKRADDLNERLQKRRSELDKALETFGVEVKAIHSHAQSQYAGYSESFLQSLKSLVPEATKGVGRSMHPKPFGRDFQTFTSSRKGGEASRGSM